ncbi:hypothetical protein PHMEG_00034049 [Phytophthora megakarya]|uniref:Uncharacterized protein n=1 Tax=Phytophthora megakarya TaxID=4795 RepID=A0A225USB6_9STRA|nr:hypothetical protein PHMEG_00034049 [Phytophthora megakarya]
MLSTTEELPGLLSLARCSTSRTYDTGCICIAIAMPIAFNARPGACPNAYHIMPREAASWYSLDDVASKYKPSPKGACRCLGHCLALLSLHAVSHQDPSIFSRR